MIIRYLLLLVFVVLNGTVYSQSGISGQVRDKQVGVPVKGASVYIDNSQAGTTTDANGVFTLSVLQTNAQLLIISCIGYKTFTLEIGKMESADSSITVLLEPEASTLDSITITATAYKPVSGKRWENIFLEYFLGDKENIKDYEIENLDDVGLFFSQRDNTLKARSRQAIRIRNNWLGYKIYFEIALCEIALDKKTFINYGHTRFEDIGKGALQLEQRRKEKYCGSLTHFLRVLYKDELVQNGFEVRSAKVVPNIERQRVLSLMKKNNYRISFAFETLGDKKVPVDSARYYYQVYVGDKNYALDIGKTSLTADSLFITDVEVFKELYFKDHLLVTYKNRLADPRKSSAPSNLFINTSYETSLLSLPEDKSILLFPNGRFDPPKQLFASGYWGRSNAIAHLLPLEFITACTR